MVDCLCKVLGKCDSLYIHNIHFNHFSLLLLYKIKSMHNSAEQSSLFFSFFMKLRLNHSNFILKAKKALLVSDARLLK